MSQVLLDTNGLISFLTDRDADQQQQAADLFRSAVDGRVQVLLHQTVLAEAVYVLNNLYRVEKEVVAALLRDLIALPGVDLLHELSWQDVLDRWPVPHEDLADACLASVAHRHQETKIATFDRRFAKRLQHEGIATLW